MENRKLYRVTTRMPNRTAQLETITHIIIRKPYHQGPVHPQDRKETHNSGQNGNPGILLCHIHNELGQKRRSLQEAGNREKELRAGNPGLFHPQF
jgi:hypothetical protein